MPGVHGVAGRASARLAGIALVAGMLLALPTRSAAHGLPPAPLTGPEAVTEPLIGENGGAEVAACTGKPMPKPDQVITGSFGRELERSYVMIPFRVSGGTDAIRIKYCHDQPQLTTVPGTDTLNKHTLDLGVYDGRDAAGELWGEDDFRGWGGSSRKDVTLSPEGTIDPDPAPVASQKTTVGFIPGRVRAGKWAVELGVAAIGQELPGEDGEVAWRVEVDLIDDPSFSDQPYRPVRYDRTPARREPGWYSGDLHVHARNSHPEDATMREAFSFAFCPDPRVPRRLCDALPAETKPGAGLDFITLSDYVSHRHWGEIGKFQNDYPGHLVIRGAEVITYRGHTNNQASAEYVDYRTGPIHEATLSRPGPGGRRSVVSLERRRGPRPPSRIFDRVHAAGGWTQINHPEIFPSEVPTFGNLCRGCSWEYSDAETRYSKVDAIEIATGPAGIQMAPEPGPNPFTLLAIDFWESAIDATGPSSNHIAAVGASDSHNAGRTRGTTSFLTQSPIGQATTVVHARRLSERAIRNGIQAGHTYVKLWGNGGPDLRLRARVPGPGERPAIMGDTLEAPSARFRAKVLNLDDARESRPGAYALLVFRNGQPFAAQPIPTTGDEFRFAFEAAGPARYRLQVQRTLAGVASIEAVSSPIYLK